MRKLLILAAAGIVAVLGTSFAIASGPPEGAVPDHAKYLGQAVDADGRLVEGYAFYHHREGHGGGPGGPGGSDGGGSTCFTVISKGLSWKTAEPYVVDPTNPNGITDAVVRSELATGIDQWEAQVSGEIFLGEDLTAIVDGADESAPDGKNEVLFRDYPEPNVVAVTLVWGVFRGSPSGRGITEWDMIFDTDYDWATTPTALHMDFRNVATHELGHALGLSHPESTCTEETMFAFVDFEETMKRDLNAGDIAGVKSRY